MLGLHARRQPAHREQLQCLAQRHLDMRTEGVGDPTANLAPPPEPQPLLVQKWTFTLLTFCDEDEQKELYPCISLQLKNMLPVSVSKLACRQMNFAKTNCTCGKSVLMIQIWGNKLDFAAVVLLLYSADMSHKHISFIFMSALYKHGN